MHPSADILIVCRSEWLESNNPSQNLALRGAEIGSMDVQNQLRSDLLVHFGIPRMEKCGFAARIYPAREEQNCDIVGSKMGAC